MHSPQSTLLPRQDARTPPGPVSGASAADAIECSARGLVEARARMQSLMSTLPEAAWLGPQLPVVNPPLWEIGHLGWFQERWLLRPQADGSLAPSILPHADALYDSARVAHATRWSLPLPTVDATWEYLEQVLDRVLDGPIARRTADGLQIPDDAGLLAMNDIAPMRAGEPRFRPYFSQLVALHEQMHAEAFVYSRQTLGYADPGCRPGAESARPNPDPPAAGQADGHGDVAVPGGSYLLGAQPGSGFVFDNEKWAHPVLLAPFAIARDAVTSGEFAAFVDDGGYARREWWSEAGWAWRERSGATCPVYWRPLERLQGWEHRRYDCWQPLRPGQAMVHVNAHEAQAWCNWASRRLPTEAEWECAASTARAAGLAGNRRHPWGHTDPAPVQARLWWPDSAWEAHPQASDALPAGDSGWGCRQMTGNVWEWTSTVFHPYPGFFADPYREYSEPWFGTHQVLRGGSFATAASLIRNSWRNFYTPDRRDVPAGFRSCAGSAG